ncbi:MAG TPA: glycosyltransferase, partial [Flavisolibacter sp.]|nr:glycosyltransferase [Flavisolibacter sp.]
NKPIVSTRVGGIADIVVENETALLADVQETERFCDHLLRLVQDDNLRWKLGSNSSKHVMERFSYQRLVKDMSQLYYQLLEKKKR